MGAAFSAHPLTTSCELSESNSSYSTFRIIRKTHSNFFSSCSTVTFIRCDNIRSCKLPVTLMLSGQHIVQGRVQYDMSV